MKYDLSQAKLGTNLKPIVDLWPKIADSLGITLKQAADFVETQLENLGLVLYSDGEYSGLWHPVLADSASGELHAQLFHHASRKHFAAQAERVLEQGGFLAY
ncbi:MAG: hypothetical protein ACRETL_10460 [Gammaproteobacteria bacterium]